MSLASSTISFKTVGVFSYFSVVPKNFCTSLGDLAFIVSVTPSTVTRALLLSSITTSELPIVPLDFASKSFNSMPSKALSPILSAALINSGLTPIIVVACCVLTLWFCIGEETSTNPEGTPPPSAIR